MKNLEYKGYIGSIDYSEEDGVLYGKIEFINALVSYEGESINSLKKAFEESVDDYLDLCAETGRQPEKPFKGSFNVRVEPELHKGAARLAKHQDITLNHLVASALKEYVGKHGNY